MKISSLILTLPLLFAASAEAAQQVTPPVRGIVQAECLVTYAGSSRNVAVTTTMLMLGGSATQVLKLGPSNRVASFRRGCDNPEDGSNLCERVACVFVHSVNNSDVAGAVNVFDFSGNTLVTLPSK